MDRESIDLRSYILGIREAYVANRDAVPSRIANPGIDLPQLQDYLQMPGENPYGRKLVFQDDVIEVILMNWGKNRSSLPHDHGQSEGWVRVLKGVSAHAYYEIEQEVPKDAKHQLIAEGTVFYAPKNLVHHMGNPGETEVITLHFYFPPIHRMEVFDLDQKRSAIVSDDCGAWWPEQCQIISEKFLMSAAAE